MHQADHLVLTSGEAPGVQATVSVNRYVRLDGTDAWAAFKAGLEISGICVVGILVLLTIYYGSLKLMAGMFKPAPEGTELPGSD